MSCGRLYNYPTSCKNFLLTNEVSLDRKLKEAILAFRIDRAMSKGRILELYLNEIYLGMGSYGVAAVALNYFDKSLDDLTIHEAAFLAGLPKAPNNYHPLRNPRAAVLRRNYVIGRMLEDGYISSTAAIEARNSPLVEWEKIPNALSASGVFCGGGKEELKAQFGEKKLYGGGLSVRSTLDPRFQSLADEVLRAGLRTMISATGIEVLFQGWKPKWVGK